MQLCTANSPTAQPQCGFAFPFAPASRSVLLPKKGELVNASPDSKGFDFGDFTNRLKVDLLAHEPVVYQEAVLTGIAFGSVSPTPPIDESALLSFRLMIRTSCMTL